MENYILEAFQKLKLIEDDFDLSADRDVVDELQSFVADDAEAIPDEPIIDLSAETEEDLSDNYIGKVILECTCCHSRIYKNEAEVFVDEESDLANIDEECPVCNNAMGYKIIGKIEQFDDGADLETEPEEEIELENDPAEEEPKESLKTRLQRKKLKESAEEAICPECGKPLSECECGKEEVNEELSELASDDSEKLVDPEEDPVLDESLTEDIDNISVDTDDTHLEMEQNEEGGVDIHTTPIDKSGEEIVPLSDEEQTDILDNVPEEDEETLDDFDFEMPEEGEEELGLENEESVEDEFAEEEPEEEEEELPEESLETTGEPVNESTDIDDFDDEAFNDLAESFLRKVYENVNTFTTTSIKDNNEQIVVEGIITFKNDKQMKSNFVFTEANETKSGKIVLEGYNETFSKQPKSFKVKGALTENNYIAESMAYKYIVRNLNEGKVERTKVCGRVKR